MIEIAQQHFRMIDGFAEPGQMHEIIATEKIKQHRRIGKCCDCGNKRDGDVILFQDFGALISFLQ